MATVGRGALTHGSAQKTDHTLDAKGHTGLSRELRVLWSYSKSRDTWSGVHGPGQPTRLSGCLWAAASCYVLQVTAFPWAEPLASNEGYCGALPALARSPPILGVIGTAFPLSTIAKLRIMSPGCTGCITLC